MRTIFGSLVVLATFAATANTASDSLAARHDRAVATTEGAAYEKVVGQTVAVNFASIEKCFPKRRTTLHVIVLFEIAPDGTIGASDASPQGDEGSCALMQIRQLKFPAGAPPNFVGKFDFVVTGK
jgi:hypothetical protein